jgi:hypothetical protein
MVSLWVTEQAPAQPRRSGREASRRAGSQLVCLLGSAIEGIDRDAAEKAGGTI